MTTSFLLPSAGTCPLSHPSEVCPVSLPWPIPSPWFQNASFTTTEWKIPLCSLFFSGRLHKLTPAPGRGAGFLLPSPHPTLASDLTPETTATWLNIYPYAKLPTQCGYLGVLWPSQNPNVQTGSAPLLSKPISPSPIFQSRGPASPLSWCLT